jgi:serine/threonine-protein kinase
MQLGRYQTLREVATGGMATVYLGRAVGEGGFERLVALKLLHRHFVDQPEFEAMFLDEAKLAARIRHPNVVPTLDVQKSSEGLFLVMDYVEGPTLAAIHKELRVQEQRLPLEILLRVFEDLLAGLEAAHSLKGPGEVLLRIVHRDISPQNVLVGGDGITRITDFGVARAAVRSTSTQQGQIKGKLGYMPPEQLAGEAVDARADIYSAGIVLWETLTGQRAFTATDTGVLVTRVLAGVERSPRSVVPELPVALDRVCMQALSIHPEQRPRSAAEFAAELALAGRSAGLASASTREVAEFVQGLQCFRARVVPSELLGALDATPEAVVVPTAPSNEASPQPAVTRRPPPQPTPSARELPAASSASPTVPAPKRWVVPTAAIAGLGAVGIGALLAYFVTRDGHALPTQPSAATTAMEGSSGNAPASATTSLGTAGATSSSDTTAAPSADSAPDASASASSTAASTAPATSATMPTAGQRATATATKSPTPSGSDRPSTNPEDYNPSDL